MAASLFVTIFMMVSAVRRLCIGAALGWSNKPSEVENTQALDSATVTVHRGRLLLVFPNIGAGTPGICAFE